jgi:hypothetical protein
LASPGANYSLEDTIRISGALLGGTTPENDIIITVTNISSTTGQGPLVDFSFVGTAIPGQFVAIAYDSDVAMSSTDGITWTARSMPAAQEWKSVAYGKINNVGRWIAISEDSNIAAVSIDGVNWQSTGELPATDDWTSITYGNGRFVAVASGSNNAAYSINGSTWVAMTGFPSLTWTDVTFGAGRFVAVALGTDTFAFSTNGISWSTGIMPTTAGWTSIAFGSNRFVAVTRGLDSESEVSNIAAFSLNGATWTQVTLPASQAWHLPILAKWTKD